MMNKYEYSLKALRLIIILCSCSIISFGKSEKELLKLAGFNTSNKLSTLNGFGTAFAISQDGFLITAKHVIKGSDEIRIVFPDGQSTHAEIIYKADTDLAILKINRRTPNFLTVSDSTLSLGIDVFTMGYPAPLELGMNKKYNRVL